MPDQPPTRNLPTACDTLPLKLLIPVDASDSANGAINYAKRLALEGTDVEVLLLYLIEPVQSWEVLKFRTRQEVGEYFRQRSEIFLAEAGKSLAAANIPHQEHCLECNAVDGILTVAKESGCTEIVLPKKTRMGVFAYGLASKLRANSTDISVLLAQEDGSVLH